jgi:chromatin structure-remodeling complex subunit RSC1/2
VDVLRSELNALAAAGTITQHDAELPDLGPLPPPSPSVSPQMPTVDDVSGDEDEDEDEEEDDDEDAEEDESDDDDSGKRKRTTRRRVSAGVTATRSSARKKGDTAPPKEEEGEEEGVKRPKDDPRRKRGRPPRVDTPMEQRIKNILKALRKVKDEDDLPRIQAFEKLPEKKEFPEYYQQIERPIALDQVRKNIKRRVYKTLEMFVADMDLMFDNAMAFNEDDSEIHADAVELKAELHKAADVERAKTDEELVGDEEQGHGKNRRIPLEKIEHRGETYRVGWFAHPRLDGICSNCEQVTGFTLSIRTVILNLPLPRSFAPGKTQTVRSGSMRVGTTVRSRLCTGLKRNSTLTRLLKRVSIGITT